MQTSDVTLLLLLVIHYKLCLYYLYIHNIIITARVAKFGAYIYDDGTKYIGDWNDRGQKHGLGHVQLKDDTRYEGGFYNGLCSGLGVLQYSDGTRHVLRYLFHIHL